MNHNLNIQMRKSRVSLTYTGLFFLTLYQMSSLSFILKKASKRNLNKGKRKANQYQPQI